MKMLSLAEAWELRSAGSNPCRTVRRYKEKKRERFLSPDETRRLDEVLDQAEAEGGASVYAVAAIRLLMLTGCRLNEVLSLRWDDVDRTAGELRIRDGKTGPRSVPLTPTVRQVLAAIPRVPGNPWVKGQATACPTSVPNGIASGNEPGLRTFGFTTSDTAGLPGHWRSARACPSSAGFSVILRWRQQPGTPIWRATRCTRLRP